MDFGPGGGRVIEEIAGLGEKLGGPGGSGREGQVYSNLENRVGGVAGRMPLVK